MDQVDILEETHMLRDGSVHVAVPFLAAHA